MAGAGTGKTKTLIERCLRFVLHEAISIDEIFARHYAGAGTESAAVLELLQSQFRSREESLRELIVELHTYTQTRPDPDGWFARQSALFADPKPAQWVRWLLQAVQFWREL